MEIENSVENDGDDSNVSAPTLQFANMGNQQNAQGFVQVNSESDDVGFEGSSFEFEPSVESESDQKIKQSSPSS